MNKRKKGNKYETEVQRFFENQGYIIHRARSSGFKSGNRFLSRSNDVFGVFDLIAKKKDNQTVWIQVSTGSRYAEKIKKIKALGDIWNISDTIQIWLRYKNKKYKIYHIEPYKNKEEKYEIVLNNKEVNMT